MNIFLICAEIIGTIAFAVSGAVTAMRRDMDLFGVCILGITTAVGGGIVRDIILGMFPVSAFVQPLYVAVAFFTSLFVFLPFMQKSSSATHAPSKPYFSSPTRPVLPYLRLTDIKSPSRAVFRITYFFVCLWPWSRVSAGGVMRDLFAG